MRPEKFAGAILCRNWEAMTKHLQLKTIAVAVHWVLEGEK